MDTLKSLLRLHRSNRAPHF